MTATERREPETTLPGSAEIIIVHQTGKRGDLFVLRCDVGHTTEVVKQLRFRNWRRALNKEKVS